MLKVIEKIKCINNMIEDNKEIAVIAHQKEEDNNKKCKCTMSDIEKMVNGQSFEIIANSKPLGKIKILTQFADSDFYVKDLETEEMYMSTCEELGECAKKITILKSSGKISEYYSYLTKNGQNELIRLAISDNNKNRKIVVTNLETDNLENTELLEYATETGLGGIVEDILANNMENIKNMINAFKFDEEEIKEQANDSYQQYIQREGEFYSEIQNDDDVEMQMEEYLKKYKVTLNGKELNQEEAKLEIGNAMTAVDEEEVERPQMWNLCYELNDSIKLQIARTQGITLQSNNIYKSRED